MKQNFFRLPAWLWSLSRGGAKDRIFERLYLDRVISRQISSGPLPAQPAGSREQDGRGKRATDLEDCFIPLRISLQARDYAPPGIYSHFTGSWQRRPTRLHRVSVTLLLFLALLLNVALTVAWSVLLSQPVLRAYIPAGESILLAVCLLATLAGRRLTQPAFRASQGISQLALVIDQQRRLVIQGEPGSGKSTLLSYLAITCARRLRKSTKPGETHRDLRQRLPWRVRPFPLLATFHFAQTATPWSKRRRLLDLFLEELPADLRECCPDGFFARKLRRGDCLILLDAFDGLENLAARDAMAAHIGDFLLDYDRLSNRIVVTTRSTDYTGQLDPYGFQVSSIQQLTADEKRALITRHYQRITQAESADQTSPEAAVTRQKICLRAEHLITKLATTPHLARLATNPHLLTLLIFVYHRTTELPAERLLLYKYAVEGLAEQWQPLAQAYSPDHPGLTPAQKRLLLQRLALHIQLRNGEAYRQRLLPQEEAQALIEQQLNELLEEQWPASERESQQVSRCEVAGAWARALLTTSGILTCQGYDSNGQPLSGFFHPGIQEYLTATAINEQVALRDLLTEHLLDPGWQEIVIFSGALLTNATPLISRLLEDPIQPAGLLLAGFCLAERTRHSRQDIRQQTLSKLKIGFLQTHDTLIETFGLLLARIGGREAVTFLCSHLKTAGLARLQASLNILQRLPLDDPQTQDVREELLSLLDRPHTVAAGCAIRETLARSDDAQAIQQEPEVIPVSRQICYRPAAPTQWHALLASTEWTMALYIEDRLALIGRVFDYWLFRTCHPLRLALPQQSSFALSRYLVTNREYARFVEARPSHIPAHWPEGTYPPELARHPVTGITARDARAYCRWLCQTTGATYRLPTEWEWEWAATGVQGRLYPWGNQFDPERANTAEAAPGETTPVGSYLPRNSQQSAADMIGNVWEITTGYFCFFALCWSLLALLSAGVFLFLSFSAFSPTPDPSVQVPAVLLQIPFALLPAIRSYLSLFSLFACLLFVILALTSLFSRVLRGGAYNTPSEQATCFSRKGRQGSHELAGFRCVKELQPQAHQQGRSWPQDSLRGRLKKAIRRCW